MNEAKSEQHPDGTECDMPTVNGGGEAKENAEEAARNQCCACIGRWFPTKPYERWSLVFSALTLGIVAWYTYYAGGQWEEAIKATRAATEGNAISRRAMEASTRAWVVVDSTKTDFLNPLQVGVPNVLRINFVNSGHTVATRVTLSTALGHHRPRIKPRIASESGATPSRGVLGPGIYLQATLETKGYSAKKLRAMAAGRAYLCAVGIIRYRDGFPKKRRTEFCLCLRPKLGAVATYSWESCPTLNNAT